MEILWMLIGFVIGLLVAWYFLGTRYSQQLAKREEELTQATQRATADLERLRAAHESTKQRLSETQAKEVSAAARIEILEDDLKARGEEMTRLQAADEERRTQLNQQQSATDELKARLSTTETTRAQLDQQLKQVQAERGAADDNSRSQIADLEERVRERDEQIAGLKAELAAPSTMAANPNSAPAAGQSRDAVSLLDATAAASGPSDDLTRIKGIGPALKDKLYGLGITSFRQIADFTPADIARVNAVLDFPERIEREQWIEQAKAIVDR